jgi:hypothetical protein
MSPCNGVFSINSLTFQDIINGINLIDRDICSQADVNLEFITTNAGVKANRLNPDRALVRY